MPMFPAQNGVTGSSSLASAGAPDASLKSFWYVVRPSIDSGVRAARPVLAVERREVAAGVPQESRAVAPVLAGQPVTGEVLLAALLLEGDRGVDELLHRGRDLELGLLEQVLAVEDVRRARVVGHREGVAVDRCALDEALQQVVAAEVGEVTAQVAERAGRGERRRLGVADLDHVGRLVLRGQRGGQALDEAVPLLLLDGEGGALVLLLERLLQPVPGRLGSVGSIEPDHEVRGLRATIGSRVVVIGATRAGHTQQGDRGRGGQCPLHAHWLFPLPLLSGPRAGPHRSVGPQETPSSPARTSPVAPTSTPSSPSLEARTTNCWVETGNT